MSSYTVGGLNKLPIARIGSITFKANIPNGVNNVILHYVLHIPTLGANLISLGLLQQASMSIRGLPFGICLAWEEQDFLHANLIGSNSTLYQIKTLTINNHNDHIAYVASKSTMHLWHCQLRHISPHMIKSMADQNLVTGLKIKQSHEFDHLCSGCAQGKPVHPPLPTSNSTKYDKDELLVMDLPGPMSVPTWDGYRYALVIVEVRCQYLKGRLLKKKDEVTDAVCYLIA